MNKKNWHIRYYRLILYICLLAVFGWLHLFGPGFRKADLAPGTGYQILPAGTGELLYRPDRNGTGHQDASAKLVKIRYSIEKPKSQADPNQRFISEKIKGNADRGPKTALLPFPGEFLNYIPLTKSNPGKYSFLFIIPWTGFSSRIRPPPVF